ncbi:patatin-like phospholipase family protein [Asticcacaulis sp. SL142]|uniref:patatin-like phospholipase family protein n=1 Tax=Asticcacaulis sp. SL142 TaxID=2995155 RepID=UPI00226CAF98|nr:patatin-like phospholipase family protein [Asticcacaulis sp. SL142]WAC47407.1 patatin-like phospholipase family protein [Asticcacaulis sp. SL142]
MDRFRIWLLVIALALSGCAGIERPQMTALEQATAFPGGFERARFASDDPQLAQKLEADLRGNFAAHGIDDFNVLALSGGGADGAFGAGVLNGWTKRGDRPPFRVVTGVSTGALMAPFAFLGTDYDDELKDGYTDGRASGLLQSRGALALFTPGLYSSNRLKALVDSYITIDMVMALAREHAKGRRLVVATTNLDSQTGVVWDISGIAREAVEYGWDQRLIDARDLIRQVLVASASLPGAFEPVIIRSRSPDGRILEEMHVDGSVTMPFFLLPESLTDWVLPPDLFRGGHIYVLINGKIAPGFAVTPYKPLPVVTRSLETLTRAQARTTLNDLSGYATRNNMKVSVMAMTPGITNGGLIEFDAESMRKVYDIGYQMGVSETAWQEK